MKIERLLEELDKLKNQGATTIPIEWLYSLIHKLEVEGKAK